MHQAEQSVCGGRRGGGGGGGGGSANCGRDAAGTREGAAQHGRHGQSSTLASEQCWTALLTGSVRAPTHPHALQSGAPLHRQARKGRRGARLQRNKGTAVARRRVGVGSRGGARAAPAADRSLAAAAAAQTVPQPCSLRAPGTPLNTPAPAQHPPTSDERREHASIHLPAALPLAGLRLCRRARRVCCLGLGSFPALPPRRLCRRLVLRRLV